MPYLFCRSLATHRTAICALEADQVARREIAVITFRAKLLRLPSPD